MGVSGMKCANCGKDLVHNQFVILLINLVNCSADYFFKIFINGWPGSAVLRRSSKLLFKHASPGPFRNVY